MARPKGTTRAKKPILKDEFDRLIRVVKSTHIIKTITKPKLIRAFTLLYLTGCRVSEIINFKTSDIEYMINQNEFSLSNDTKTKKPRLISFDSDGVQADILKNILPSCEVYIFCKNNSDEPMSVQSLKFMMNKFIHKILGELYSTHSFRSGYITISHKQGLSLEHIREDIGHTNISTTARYTVVTSDEISKAKNRRKW